MDVDEDAGNNLHRRSTDEHTPKAVSNLKSWI